MNGEQLAGGAAENGKQRTRCGSSNNSCWISTNSGTNLGVIGLRCEGSGYISRASSRARTHRSTIVSVPDCASVAPRLALLSDPALLIRLTRPETRSEVGPGRSEWPNNGVPGTEDAGVNSGLRGVRTSPGPKIDSNSVFTSVCVGDFTGV